MFCHNCGGKIRDGVNFCPHCGKMLNELETGPKNDLLKEDGEKNLFAERAQDYAEKAKETAQQVPDTVISSANSMGDMGNDDNHNSSFFKKNNWRNAKILSILLLCVIFSVIAFESREPSLEERQKAYLAWFRTFTLEAVMPMKICHTGAQKTWDDMGKKKISRAAAKDSFIKLSETARKHANNLEAMGIPSNLSSEEKKALKDSLKYCMDAMEKSNRFLEMSIEFCSSDSKNKEKTNALLKELMQLKKEASDLMDRGMSGVMQVGQKLGVDSQNSAGGNEALPSQNELQSRGKNASDFADTPKQEHEQHKQPKEQERAKSGDISQATTNVENEVYVGTYDSGLKAYVLADTLIMNDLRNFSVTVKAVENNNNIIYVSYRFGGSPGNPTTWKNSQGYSGTVNYDKPSVEKNIHVYCSKRWFEQVEKGRK